MTRVDVVAVTRSMTAAQQQRAHQRLARLRHAARMAEVLDCSIAWYCGMPGVQPRPAPVKLAAHRGRPRRVSLRHLRRDRVARVAAQVEFARQWYAAQRLAREETSL